MRRAVRHRVTGGSAALAALWLTLSGATAATLQQMIDAAAEGALIRPEAGVYAEHLIIRRGVTVDGSKGVTIDGGGQGTIVEIASNNVTLKNLTIRNSGRLHNQSDAAVRVEGSFNVLKDLRIENALFGIDLHDAHSNILRRNDIGGNDLPLEMRGDSIHLWHSNDNEIADNVMHDARDFVIWYSEGNKVTGNRVTHGRYGLHYMYSHHNTMENNEIADCVVGVFLMYSNDTVVRHNRILRAWGASGMGVGFKESSGAVLEDNEIVGNAVGLFIDVSPFDPDSQNVFTGNTIAYNGTGVEFHTDWQGNVFSGNSFLSNHAQIVVRGGGTALHEIWTGNYWDDNASFDGNGDGAADSPYEIYSYADRLWMEVPDAAFFRGAPAMEMLDFVERLAPFSEPQLLLREDKPLMQRPAATAMAAPKSALELLQ